LNESETQQVNNWCLLGFDTPSATQPNLLFTQPLRENEFLKRASDGYDTPNYDKPSSVKNKIITLTVKQGYDKIQKYG